MASRDPSLDLLTSRAADDLATVRAIVTGFDFADDIAVEEEVDGSLYVRGYVD